MREVAQTPKLYASHVAVCSRPALLGLRRVALRVNMYQLGVPILANKPLLPIYTQISSIPIILFTQFLVSQVSVIQHLGNILNQSLRISQLACQRRLNQQGDGVLRITIVRHSWIGYSIYVLPMDSDSGSSRSLTQ